MEGPTPALASSPTHISPSPLLLCFAGNAYFWHHEWEKHGSCGYTHLNITNFPYDDVVVYFTETLNLAAEYDLNSEVGRRARVHGMSLSCPLLVCLMPMRLSPRVNATQVALGGHASAFLDLITDAERASGVTNKTVDGPALSAHLRSVFGADVWVRCQNDAFNRLVLGPGYWRAKGLKTSVSLGPGIRCLARAPGAFINSK